MGNVVITDFSVLKTRTRTYKKRNNKRDFQSISYRIGGVTKISTKDVSLVSNPSSITYVPKDCTYDTSVEGGEMIVIHFSSNEDYSKQPFVLCPVNSEHFKNLFLQAYERYVHRINDFDLMTASVVYEILASVKTERQIISPIRKIMPSLKYIDLHFANMDISVPEIAALSGISETYFRRILKRFTAFRRSST